MEHSDSSDDDRILPCISSKETKQMAGNESSSSEDDRIIRTVRTVDMEEPQPVSSEDDSSDDERILRHVPKVSVDEVEEMEENAESSDDDRICPVVRLVDEQNSSDDDRIIGVVKSANTEFGGEESSDDDRIIPHVQKGGNEKRDCSPEDKCKTKRSRTRDDSPVRDREGFIVDGQLAGPSSRSGSRFNQIYSDNSESAENEDPLIIPVIANVEESETDYDQIDESEESTDEEDEVVTSSKKKATKQRAPLKMTIKGADPKRIEAEAGKKKGRGRPKKLQSHVIMPENRPKPGRPSKKRSKFMKKTAPKKSRKLNFCETCGLQFPNAPSYSRHKKIHEEKSAVSCPKCNGIYARPDILKKHLRTQHNVIVPNKKPGRPKTTKQQEQSETESEPEPETETEEYLQSSGEDEN